MSQVLTGLEIKILLKCAQRTLSKTQLSQSFRTTSLEQRHDAIEKLIDLGFITALERPNPTLTIVRKTPIHYEMTQKGRDWLETYNREYAKSCPDFQISETF